MKLIDLDEIEYFTLVDKDGIPRYKIEIGDGLPIVKAIPIEWILKWACEFIDPNSEGYKMAMELVHDWRKENEENI